MQLHLYLKMLATMYFTARWYFRRRGTMPREINVCIFPYFAHHLLCFPGNLCPTFRSLLRPFLPLGARCLLPWNAWVSRHFIWQCIPFAGISRIMKRLPAFYSRPRNLGNIWNTLTLCLFWFSFTLCSEFAFLTARKSGSFVSIKRTPALWILVKERFF